MSPDRDETAGSLADDLVSLEDRRQQSGIPSRRGHARSAAVFTEYSVDAEHHASLIRTVLARDQTAAVTEMREPESSSA